MNSRIKIHFVIFTLILLVLIFFYGLNLVIRINYANLPEEIDYFDGPIPTTGQLLMSGFNSLEVIIESFIISLIVAIGSFFTKINDKGIFAGALLLTFLVTLVYFLFKFVPGLFMQENPDFFINELLEELAILGALFFSCSFITLWVTNRLKIR